MIGSEKCFTANDLIEYIDSLLRCTKQKELKIANRSNYGWLMSKNMMPLNIEEDLEGLKPMIRKMSSESCVTIAVTLDKLPDNVCTAKILSILNNLLEEQYSMQEMAGNIRRAKDTKNKVNKVRPLLTEGRVSTVIFMLKV